MQTYKWNLVHIIWPLSWKSACHLLLPWEMCASTFVCLCIKVFELRAHMRQMDRQHRHCGLLGWAHNKEKTTYIDKKLTKIIIKATDVLNCFKVQNVNSTALPSVQENIYKEKQYRRVLRWLYSSPVHITASQSPLIKCKPQNFSQKPPT